MKSVFFKGMLAVALTFGLVFAACSSDDGSGSGPDVSAISLPLTVAELQGYPNSEANVTRAEAVTFITDVLQGSLGNVIQTTRGTVYADKFLADNSMTVAAYKLANLRSYNKTTSFTDTDDKLKTALGVSKAVLSGSQLEYYSSGNRDWNDYSALAKDDAWTDKRSSVTNVKITDGFYTDTNGYKIAGAVALSSNGTSTTRVTDAGNKVNTGSNSSADKAGVLLTISDGTKAGKFKLTFSSTWNGTDRSATGNYTDATGELEVYDANGTPLFTISSQNSAFGQDLSAAIQALSNW